MHHLRTYCNRKPFDCSSAGWKRFSQNNGAEYVSVTMSAPEFGTIYGNVANAPGDDPMKKVIIWNPPA